MILAAALAVPGLLFYNWWSHMKAARGQNVFATSRGRVPEGGLFEAAPNPSRLVNPISSSATVAVAETESVAGAAQAAVIPPPADSMQAGGGAPPEPAKLAAAAPPPPSLKRDPMISPFDALRLKEIEDRKRASERQLNRYKPRGDRSIESSIELLGIISGPSGAPKAIVNNEIIGVGQKINGARVLRITDSSVTFEYKGKKFTKSVGR
jgi:hypothetical protein